MRNRPGVLLVVALLLLIPLARKVVPLSTAYAQASDEKGLPKDRYQRSAEIFTYTAGAKSGPTRGEELYYYKCWFCHNQYAKTGPQLRELYKRGTFESSGDEVSDRSVATKINEGGAGMPAFRSALREADISDLVSYIKSGNCCFNSQDPPPNARYLPARTAAVNHPARLALAALRGGPRGVVHNASGEALEGIGIQLISAKTAIRTTVYTKDDGRYEFPVLDQGSYALRIALPREYEPYVKESVPIEGATQLDDVVLERVGKTELLPPTPEILSQLTGTEWLMNIPGTGEEKRVFSLDCGFGCHSYQQIFRNRYDERSWRLIVQRMTRGGGAPLINMNRPTPETLDRADRSTLQDEDLLIKWLSTVRGPDSQDKPLYYLPRPRGAATRVVVTEYELPRNLLSPHDVSGDSKGNIWYTAFRSPYQGVLDPKNGAVKEYRIPETGTPEVLPGTHRVWVDKNDIVWFSESWDHYLTALDPKTGKVIKRYSTPGEHRLNASAFGNFAMDDQGFVYTTRLGTRVAKYDSKTGELVQTWPFKKMTSETYDSIVTPDGRYWAGAPVGKNQIGLLDTKSGQIWELETGPEVSSASRGGFDPQGNAWFGGRGGMLIKLDPKTRRITKYYPPEEYDTFYECLPDKNGEIWAGGLHSGHVLRFNPKTEKWTSYMMPEPYSHDRKTWIDNSTTPVTVWFVVQEGYMVRVQPLE